MIDTAKPTPGPYKLQISTTQPLALWSDNANGVILEAKWRHGFPPQRDLLCEEALENLTLAKESFETYHETNLTPRQLLEQRDELVTALRAAQNALTRCARPTDDDLKMSTRDAWILCVDAESKARAALGKHGEDV